MATGTWIAYVAGTHPYAYDPALGKAQGHERFQVRTIVEMWEVEYDHDAYLRGKLPEKPYLASPEHSAMFNLHFMPMVTRADIEAKVPAKYERAVKSLRVKDVRTGFITDIEAKVDERTLVEKILRKPA